MRSDRTPEPPSGGDYDVIVLGGGPAGSLTSAIVLRDNPGRRVLVLEKERFPRHHVGESTIPSWRPVLERAGVLEKLVALAPIEKAGGHFWWGRSSDRSWTIDFREPPAYESRPASFHVDRAHFDHVLLDHAASLGADVRQEAQVVAIDRPTEGRVRVQWLEGGTLREAHAPWIVDGSGQSRLLSRQWELEVRPFDGMNNFAVYGYWQGSAMTSYGPTAGRQRWTTIATCPDGWAWHIPIGPDLVSVGVVTDKARLPGEGGDALEAFYRRNVAECRGIGEQLGRATLAEHPLAPERLMVVRDWSYFSPTICGDHYFLVGDAAAFVDPVFSTGLLICANGAMLTANALSTMWQDPAADVPLLQRSLRESYLNIAMSFHRLASVWYTRNFRYPTLHWEAHRQRLRTGGDPAEEESATAFRALCMGSFADPISGVLYNPARPRAFDAYRVDLDIMAKQFFDEPAEAPDDDLPTTERDMRARRARQDLQHWRRLIDRRTRVAGAAWAVEERYFTDASSPRWERVRFVRAAAVGCTDPFDYVVFSSFDDLPESLLPFLDGTGTLRDVMLGALAPVDPGSREWDDRLALFHRLISQLDLRGWLCFEGPEPIEIAGDWPPPLREAFAGVAGAEITADLVGSTLRVRMGSREGFNIVARPRSAASRVGATRPGAVLRETELVFRGRPEHAHHLDRLAHAWRAWEATPASAGFWERSARGLAGGRMDA